METTYLKELLLLPVPHLDETVWKQLLIHEVMPVCAGG